MVVSERDIDRDLELARDAHRRLLDHLEQLASRAELDVSAPSRLPGWTRGHVITHIANSGVGHRLMLDAALEGRVGMQYPHGIEGRAADIEAGAVLVAGEQLELLRRSIADLEASWVRPHWNGTGIAPAGGEVAIADLPFFRIRETAIHHVDLDIGFEFADLDPDYVEREIEWMTTAWRSRIADETASLPDPVLELPPEQRLAWLTGRRHVDRVPPARVF